VNTSSANDKVQISSSLQNYAHLVDRQVDWVDPLSLSTNKTKQTI